MALSQFVPALKIGYFFTYFGPLCFVLTLTLSKEAYDDYQRYLRDTEANSQIYKRLTNLGSELIPSSKIRVGDSLMIQKNQRVPADCILLRTTEAQGACFIRTDQLDGETDWKLRLAVSHTQNLKDDESLLRIEASVYGASFFISRVGSFPAKSCNSRPAAQRHTFIHRQLHTTWLKWTVSN